MDDEFDDYIRRNAPQPADEFDDFIAANSAPAPKPEGRAMQTALEEGADTLTLGNLSRIQAGARPITDKAFELASQSMRGKVTIPSQVDASLEAQGFNIQGPDDSYIAERDRNNKRREAQAAENPKAATAGKVAGFGLSIPVAMAASPAAAATLPGRMWQAGKIGAATGALVNPGDVEGEASGLQLGERVQNAGLGAATAAALTPAVEKVVGPVAGWVSRQFSDRASRKAVHALGGTKKQVEKLQASGDDVGLGRQLLDDGAIPVLGTPRRIASRVGEIKNKTGSEIGAIVGEGGNVPVVDAAKISSEIAKGLDLDALASVPGGSRQAAIAKELLDTLSSNGQMSIEQTQALRQAIDKQINFAKKVPELRGQQEILYKIRSALRDAMNEGSESLGIPGLREANKKFSRAATAASMVEGRVARDAANRAIGLTDTISGGAGATVGGLMGGPAGATAGAVAGTAINKMGRTFGASISARTNDALSKVFRGGPALQAFVAKNPVLAGTIAARLGTKAGGFERAKEQPILNDPKILGIFKSNPQLVESLKDERLKNEIQKKLRGPSSE